MTFVPKLQKHPCFLNIPTGIWDNLRTCQSEPCSASCFLHTLTVSVKNSYKVLVASISPETSKSSMTHLSLSKWQQRDPKLYAKKIPKQQCCGSYFETVACQQARHDLLQSSCSFEKVVFATLPAITKSCQNTESKYILFSKKHCSILYIATKLKTKSGTLISVQKWICGSYYWICARANWLIKNSPILV